MTSSILHKIAGGDLVQKSEASYYGYYLLDYGVIRVRLDDDKSVITIHEMYDVHGIRPVCDGPVPVLKMQISDPNVIDKVRDTILEYLNARSY